MNNLTGLLAKAKQNPGCAPVRGHWFNIRLCPDLAAGELLNIGVGFVGVDGALSVRLLEKLDGLNCLYRGRLLAEDVAFLMRTLRTSLPKSASARELPSLPSPNLVYSTPQYVAGVSVDDILSELFEETVSLAKAGRLAESEAQKPSVDTKAARKLVFDQLKKRDAWADRYLAPEWDWVVEESGVQHVLDMPLRGVGRFGSVVSAGYRQFSTIELGLLRAESDLSVAQRLYPDERAGLFLLRPLDMGLFEFHNQQVDRLIDLLEWKARVRRIHLSVGREPEELANLILDWTDAA